LDHALLYHRVWCGDLVAIFVYHDLSTSYNAHSLLLWSASIVIFFAALVDFEALRVGKISIIEPIYSLEVAVTAVLAGFFIHEGLSSIQIASIVILVLGIFLTSTRSFRHFKHIHIERGVWYAILGTIGMGATNFLFGVGARETNPLVINWFTDVFIMVATFLYLLNDGKLRVLVRDFREHRRLILNVSFFDNLAWITFSYATLYIPIAVATGISEGYIAFAGGLGILFNKEELKIHQWIGLALAVGALIVLGVCYD
jgi:drug/metabolite transporter (DMT)-like permease